MWAEPVETRQTTATGASRTTVAKTISRDGASASPLRLAGWCGNPVAYGLAQQRSKCGLLNLVEGGDLHAPHGKPARSLPTSGSGHVVCLDGKPGCGRATGDNLGNLARRSQLVARDEVRYFREIEGEAEALSERRNN
jgi:hypothetical protein